MAVFGNSNSLPISLVISLSRTIPSLRWNKIPNDNSDEVAARGILYLMIFQQLGQILRWSWGYRQLLAKPETFTAEEGGNAAARLESAEEDSASERDSLLVDPDEHSYSTLNPSAASSSSQLHLTLPKDNAAVNPSSSSATLDELHHRYLTRKSSDFKAAQRPKIAVYGPSGTLDPFAEEDHVRLNSPASWARGLGRAVKSLIQLVKRGIAQLLFRIFLTLPPTVQSSLKKAGNVLSRFSNAVWELMNAPLWAMIAAVVVACSPQLHHYFFTKGTFVNTSVTRAVEQTGQVAIPLILLVLGANLANNTKPIDNDLEDTDEPKLERKLVIVSLLCRMLLPTLIMAPILALFAKYVPVSILDDPVFVVVAFLLTGAPSALQLAQICQINDVYIGAMTSILFQSYVIWYVFVSKA
jgi:predicted permease